MLEIIKKLIRGIIMINKVEKKFKIWSVGAIIGILTISFSLIGCDFRKLPKGDAENKETAVSTIEKQNASEKVIKKDNKSVNSLKTSCGKDNFIEYIGLIGLSKEKLISTLNENPNSIDEGGLEFKKAGIRVWFDKKNNTQVDQVFIMNSDINLNGVKIGDKISRFKEVFGNPISDRNGDAHFKYTGIFLSVNYDTNSQQTYGVYILKNDF